MCYTLFVDVETSGLPVTIDFDTYHHPSKIKKYDNSRIIELAYMIYDKDKTLKKQLSHIIKPTEFDIENSHIHGITKEDAMEFGVDIIDVFQEMKEDIKDVDTIVSHNLRFDLNIILSECYRYDQKDIIKKLKHCDHICTMMLGRDVMKIKKRPKLIELYEHLFSKTFDQKHRALSDTVACKDCYYEMLEK
jgi:DNA polymerase III epsilon subunit-like protein